MSYTVSSGTLNPSNTWYLESGVRVTFDVGYLCANFALRSRNSVGQHPPKIIFSWDLGLEPAIPGRGSKPLIIVFLRALGRFSCAIWWPLSLRPILFRAKGIDWSSICLLPNLSVASSHGLGSHNRIFPVDQNSIAISSNPPLH